MIVAYHHVVPCTEPHRHADPTVRPDGAGGTRWRDTTPSDDPQLTTDHALTRAGSGYLEQGARCAP